MQEAIEENLTDLINVMFLLQKDPCYVNKINEIVLLVTDCLKKSNKLMFIGNGGSAADCQHMAGEYVGRFLKERVALPAVALTTDTSILTALANDYGIEAIFRRQIEAIGRPGDILFAYSTSGFSINVIEAIKFCKANAIKSILFTGTDDSPAARGSDICIQIPSSCVPRIQEAHLFTGHLICQLVEKQFAND